MAGIFRFTRAAIIITALASFIFYSWHDWRFTPLLLASICINFLMGKNILSRYRTSASKGLLIISLILNLGVLFIFKYTIFSVSTINEITSTAWKIPDIVLPIGISFYTFTQIAYLVDCYRGYAHIYRFWDYVLFVTFFPHLIAGPILKHAPFISQLERGRFGRPSLRRAHIGLLFFAIGLAKKVLVADSLSPYAAQVFNHASTLSFAEAWLGALTYTFQLYYDFSGYSEMAVGLGLLLNLRIPLNFNSPYKARSIINFWQRWHMSLSYFLKHYLYFSLGGNRVGAYRHYFNLFITMLLGGIWHGAGWTYVIWGALHGTYLIINHLWRKTGIHIHAGFCWFLTFLAVVIAWVFFRAKNYHDSLFILGSMLGLKQFHFQFAYIDRPALLFAVVAVLIVCAISMFNTQQMAIRRKPSFLLAVIAGLLMLVSIMSLSNPSEFLYFQF